MMPTPPLPSLDLDGEPTCEPEGAALERAACDLGIQLPRSYVEFALRYGYGLTAGLYLIYVPKQNGDDLVVRSRVLQQRIRDAMAHGFIGFEPDGNVEIANRLVPFGYSENGETLAWDPQDVGDDHEMAIYLLDAGVRAMRRIGYGLGAFFESVCAIEHGARRSSAALAPTFLPSGRPRPGPPVPVRVPEILKWMGRSLDDPELSRSDVDIVVEARPSPTEIVILHSKRHALGLVLVDGSGRPLPAATRVRHDAEHVRTTFISRTPLPPDVGLRVMVYR